jgi:hypothetical protein
LKLICYRTAKVQPKIVPAPMRRDWMDETTVRFAYRCLPLNIANTHGWVILNCAPFVAQWHGGDSPEAISIAQIDGSKDELLAQSHFGHGVLTFHVGCLFRSEPNYDLWVSGPLNTLKDAVQPLTGIAETDWSVATFTMNWKFTRSDTLVAFERDEPFCMIFPIQRGSIEHVEPEFRNLDSDPELADRHRIWSDSREKFLADLKLENSQARQRGWQRDYFAGKRSAGDAPDNHRLKLRVRPFSEEADGNGT